MNVRFTNGELRAVMQLVAGKTNTEAAQILQLKEDEYRGLLRAVGQKMGVLTQTALALGFVIRVMAPRERRGWIERAQQQLNIRSAADAQIACWLADPENANEPTEKLYEFSGVGADFFTDFLAAQKVKTRAGAAVLCYLGLREAATSAPSLLPGFSERELCIMELVALGLPNEQIAARLFLSTVGVVWNISRVLELLEPGADRCNIVVYFLRQALTPELRALWIERFPLGKITNAQRQVISVLRGSPNATSAEIANKLGKGETTVKTHLCGIYRNHRALESNRQSLVLLAELHDIQ